MSGATWLDGIRTGGQPAANRATSSGAGRGGLAGWGGAAGGGGTELVIQAVVHGGGQGRGERHVGDAVADPAAARSADEPGPPSDLSAGPPDEGFGVVAGRDADGTGGGRQTRASDREAAEGPVLADRAETNETERQQAPDHAGEWTADALPEPAHGWQEATHGIGGHAPLPCHRRRVAQRSRKRVRQASQLGSDHFGHGVSGSGQPVGQCPMGPSRHPDGHRGRHSENERDPLSGHPLHLGDPQGGAPLLGQTVESRRHDRILARAGDAHWRVAATQPVHRGVVHPAEDQGAERLVAGYLVASHRAQSAYKPLGHRGFPFLPGENHGPRQPPSALAVPTEQLLEGFAPCARRSANELDFGAHIRRPCPSFTREGAHGETIVARREPFPNPFIAAKLTDVHGKRLNRRLRK
jgi:hypothetical protein